MDFKNLTKKQSGFFILIVYIFSFLIGYLGIYYLVLNDITNFITALFIADILMTLIIFIASLITKNASFYDPYWSVTPIFLTLMCLVANKGLSNLKLNGILISFVILLWGLRLTYNWWKNWEGFTKQDWRYDMLKEKSKKYYPFINLFGIHLFPTLIVFIQVINVNEITKFDTVNLLFITGILVSILAVVLQQISDVQMYNFRTKNKGSSKMINIGLWRFSRHPNYLAEILFWLGIYIAYLSNNSILNINISYPILMYLMFRFISIPMMEKKLSKRKGYTEYVERVSPLIFLPNKSPKDK